MRNVKAIAFDGKIKFDSLQDFKGNPAWNIRNVERVEWEINDYQYYIEFKKGTLIRYLVSPDGQFLILIFEGNMDYPDPCNCVIYDREGQVYKIVCAPKLIGNWIKDFRNKEEIPGKITGGVVEEIYGKKQVTLFVRDLEEYYQTGIYYYEQRVYDLATGEFGEMVSWQLPLR